MPLKGDRTNAAYSMMRRSGITVDPTAGDNVLALSRLEEMAHEYQARNINLSYFFEQTPDANSPHNIPKEYRYAVSACLVPRIFSDFKGDRDIPPSLQRQIRSAFSFLSSATAVVREVQYPARHPIGSGLRRLGFRQRFFVPTEQVPLSAKSETMAVDNVDDFVENFGAYLRDGETISSFTIEADTGLTVVSSSLSSPDISYQIRADGGSGEDASEPFLQVRIVATTSDGRRETRLIDFELIDTEL